MDYGTVMLLEDSPNIKVSVYDFSKLFATFSILLTYPFSLLSRSFRIVDYSITK